MQEALGIVSFEDGLPIPGPQAAEPLRSTLTSKLQLLAFLCITEADRLTMWADPMLVLGLRPHEYLAQSSIPRVPLKVSRVAAGSSPIIRTLPIARLVCRRTMFLRPSGGPGVALPGPSTPVSP